MDLIETLSIIDLMATLSMMNLVVTLRVKDTQHNDTK
jgi:hypothetical protein